MKCRIYDYNVEYCYCTLDKRCMEESCVKCLTLYENLESNKCCGKCKEENLVSLGFSDETKELAKRAVEKCNSCKNENIEEWAKKLANDVCSLTD